MTNDKRQAEKERKQADERTERMKLGIFCLECGEYCYLSADGKRWLCKIEAHN